MDKMNRKTILQSVITIVLFFLINFGLWEILVDNNIAEEWASFSVYTVLVIVVISIWQKKIFREWVRFKEEVNNWAKFFIELVLFLVIAVVVGYLLLYLVDGQFQTKNTENVKSMVDKIPPIMSLIMMSIFTPIIEEFTFRESMIGFVNKKNKILTLVMMVVSVVVFDFIHLYRLQDFFYYLPLSIALTVFYVKYNKNICSSMLMHALANLPGAILMLVGIM